MRSYRWIKFVLGILVEGHLVIISTKLFWILTTGFTEENFKVFVICDNPRPLVAMFLTDCRGSPNTISAKSISIHTTGFRGVDVWNSFHKYIWGTVYASWWPCFRWIKFVLATFVEGYPLIISYQIILNSYHRFQRNIFLKVALPRKATPPGGHAFWRIKFLLATFLEGHLVTISAKLFWFLTAGFWGEYLFFFVNTISYAPWLLYFRCIKFILAVL